MSSGRAAHLAAAPKVSIAGSQGDAAPDSLLGQLRKQAATRREESTLTIDFPERTRWHGMLRVRYGTIGLDQLERFETTTLSNIAASLEIMAEACQAIEAWDAAENKWLVLEDEIGPITFDDRLTRLLNWPRPTAVEGAPQFEFSVKVVYETMFDGDAFALTGHVNAVARFMGVTEEAIAAGEALTPGGSMPSQPPPRSG